MNEFFSLSLAIFASKALNVQCDVSHSNDLEDISDSSIAQLEELQ